MFVEMFDYWIVRKGEKEIYVSPETVGAWVCDGWKKIKQINLKKCPQGLKDNRLFVIILMQTGRFGRI